MSTIRVQALPKFPASVEAGDGILITRSGGVFTFAVDPDVVPDFSSALPFSVGDMLVADSANSFGKIAAATGGAVQALIVNGPGTPSWAQLPLGSAVTGTLGVANGGTGVTSSLGSGSNILSAGTLAISAGETLTATASLTLAGTDGKTLTVNNSGVIGGADAWTLQIGASKTLTVNNTLTINATDGSTLSVGAGGTLGTAAYVNTGTSGATVPLCNSATVGWAGVHTITTGSSSAGLTLLSGSAGNLSDIVIGRTAGELSIGVASANNHFINGTVAGDAAIVGTSGGIVWIAAAAAAPAIKIANSGALTFSQHTTGNLTVNGSGVLSASRGQLFGTATNDSAIAGNIGELIESEILVGSAVPQTTGTSTNITSISLTAGDWDVWATYFTNMAGGTTTTAFEAAISTTTNTLPTRPGKGAHVQMNCSGVGQNYGASVGTRRISLSGTTTVYLVGNATFSGSTLSGFGYLGARRVR